MIIKYKIIILIFNRILFICLYVTFYSLYTYYQYDFINDV